MTQQDTSQPSPAYLNERLIQVQRLKRVFRLLLLSKQERDNIICLDKDNRQGVNHN